MLGSLWRQLVMKRMARAAARGGRPVLRVEGLEDRVTPAAVFAVPSAAAAPASVSVFDAATRAPKFVLSPFPGFTGGLNVAVGDVNGDGTADVIVAPAAGGGPVVNVYSGTDGSLLKSFAAGDDGSRAGAGVAAADFDADGLSDIVVGAVRNGQPLVQVYRFADLTVLRGYTPFSGAGGVSVAAADVTGDGTPDVVAGAGPGGGPQVVVFDGRTDAPVRNFFAFEPSFTGGVGVSAGDATGDGRADILVSAGPTGGPRVSLFAGADGVVLANFFAYSDQLRGGVQATLADSDGNGTLDIVTSDGSAPKAFDARTMAQLAVPPGGGLMVGSPQDIGSPTVTLTTAATDPTGASPIPFTATFSEPANGFTAADVTVTNGTAANVVRVDARTYTFDVTPTADGPVTVTVAAGAAADAAGNDNTASAPVTRSYDATGAAVTVNALTTNDTTPTLTGTVAESTAGVSVSVGGQTVTATVSGTTWSATLPAELPEGTYTVTAASTDTAGNTRTATGTLVVDTTAPSAAVTTTAPDPTGTSPIPFTVTFSEDVTGFGTAGLSVTNGVVSGFTPVDARTYTFNVSPQAQGTVSVSVNAAAATDAAGNGNTASAAVTRTFDSAGPVVTATPLTTNDPTPTLTGTVDDANATVTVVVGGQSITATVTSTTWSADVPTDLDEGTYDIVVTATDALGNSGTTTATGALVIDLTAPAATVTAPTGPTNANPISFTVGFDEDVNGFDATGVTVTGGTVLDVTPGAGAGYTVRVTPGGDGTVTLTVNPGAAQDAAGNGNTASNAAAVEYDGTAPAATLSTAAADPTGTSPVSFTVMFSEVVTGFDESGLDVTNGTASNVTTADGLTYTFDVTPAGDGPVGVTVAAGAAADAAGNPTLASDAVTVVFDGTAPTAAADPLTTNSTTPTLTGTVDDPDATVTVEVDGQTITATVTGMTWTADVPTDLDEGTYDVVVTATDALGNSRTTTLTGGLVIDLTAPTAAVTTTEASPTNDTSLTFTVTFGEAVTGFDQTGLTVTGGSVSGFTPNSATSYTVVVTPGGDGPVGVSVDAGAAQDAAGNPNPVSNTATVEYDGTVPTAAVDSTATDPTAENPIPFTVTFTEDVAGFTAAGLTVTGGSVVGFAAADGRTYTFSVVPDGPGLVSVTVNAGAAADAADNPNPASAPATRLFNGTVTTAAVTSPEASPTNAATIPVTVTFTDDVTGFDADDLVVVNGSASNFVPVSGSVYTFDLTPAGDGDVTVALRAGAALDPNNAPTAAATFTITSDTTAPTAAVAADGTSPTNADPIAFTVTFSEDVTGFDQTGITVTGGALSGVSQTDTRTYTVFVTPGGDGPVDVSVNADAAQDAAGNGNTASVAATVEYDGTAPTATVSTAASDPTGTSPIGFTVTFDEDVTGFGTSGLDVTNGTVSNFVTVDARTYTFDVTPAGDGPVGVTVAAGAAADAAGNPSLASDTVTVAFDGTAPTAVADPLTTSSPTPTLTGSVDDPDATVTVVVGGQTVAATVTGTAWTADVPAALDDGTYDVVVTATDALGNSATTTATGGLVVDTTAPTVTISAPSVATTAGGPVTFTVTYADATPLTVTLADADVSLVTTGTATGTVSVSGSGLMWTVTVSDVTGDGTIGIVIAAGTATDAAGNTAGGAGPSVTFEADNAAPAAPAVAGLDSATDTGASAADGVTNNPTPTFAGAAEAGAAVELFADDGSGPVSLGTATADATTGAWSLTPTDPLADGAYTVTAVATDAAGNAGGPSASFSLVIDTADPTATVDPTPTGGVSGTAADAGGSGVARVRVSVREPGVGGRYYDEESGGFTSEDPLFFDATDDSTAGDFSAWSYALPPGTAGGYSVTARVTDLAGNEADSAVTSVLVA